MSGNIENAVQDLEYFRNELIRLYEEKELLEDKLIDIKGFVNAIITYCLKGLLIANREDILYNEGTEIGKGGDDMTAERAEAIKIIEEMPEQFLEIMKNRV